MITSEMVQQAQNKWGNVIVQIGEFKTCTPECKEHTIRQLTELYNFSKDILFKPTKAADSPFRPNLEAALSYFIGNNDNFKEDKGFALNPWTAVRFENQNIILKKDSALAMGHYFFTTTGGDEVKVEYSFGYILVDGELKIELHHSSLPYSG